MTPDIRSQAVALWHIEVLGDYGWMTHKPTPNWTSAAYAALPQPLAEALMGLHGAARALNGAFGNPAYIAARNALRAALAQLDALCKNEKEG